MKGRYLVALLVSATLSFCGTNAFVQGGGASQVSMVNLQVVHNSDGS